MNCCSCDTPVEIISRTLVLSYSFVAVFPLPIFLPQHVLFLLIFHIFLAYSQIECKATILACHI